MFRQWIIGFLCIVMGCASAESVVADKSKQVFNDQQKQAIEQIIGDYLGTHSDVVLQALYAGREKEEMLKKADAQAYLDSHIADILKIAMPMKVEKNAQVTAVVFVDYQCSFCKKIHNALDSITVPTNISYIQMPILGPQSIKAASIILSSKPEQFQNISNALFNRSDVMKEEQLITIAKKYKITMVSDDVLQKRLRENFEWAQNLGIQGVPAIIVTNGKEAQLFSGYVDVKTLEDAMQKMIAPVATQTQAASDTTAVATQTQAPSDATAVATQTQAPSDATAVVEKAPAVPAEKVA